MVRLVDLPVEIVSDILGWVSPDDLLSMRQVSRWLNDCIRDNVQLARTVYCNHFDVPPPNTSLDWQQELDDFLRLQSICASDNPRKTTQLRFVHRTVKRLLANSARIKEDDTDTLFHHRPFRNIEHLSRILNTPSNHVAFFCRSYIFDRLRRAWKFRTEDRAGRTEFLERRETRRVRRAAAGDREGGDANSDTNSDTDADADTERDRVVVIRNTVAPPYLLKPDQVSERYQMSAELHCLLGTVLLMYPQEDQSYDPVYPYAVSRTYDTREYAANPAWGPFLPGDQREVDWEKLEAMLIVLRYNIRDRRLLQFPILNKYWNNTFLGSYPDSYLPMIRNASSQPATASTSTAAAAAAAAAASIPAAPTSTLDSRDPYGVTGTWMRLVCFLDYSDFSRLNFAVTVPDNMPHPPFSEGEELRFIIMKIQVSKIDPPGADDHPDYPVVHFEGASHSMDNPWDDNSNSGLRGHVRTTRQGHVHWTTASIFDSRERWRSESIQIGGHRSGRGVVGNWFSADYDPQGPCGPSAFWKLHDESVSETAPGQPVQTFSQFLSNTVEPDGVNVVISVTQPLFHYVASLGTAPDDEEAGEDDDEYMGDDFEDGEDMYDDDYGPQFVPMGEQPLHNLSYYTLPHNLADEAADDEGDAFHENAQHLLDFNRIRSEIEARIYQQIHDDPHLLNYNVLTGEPSGTGIGNPGTTTILADDGDASDDDHDSLPDLALPPS